jgi:glycosyltransferase involved in cell wall biosynthesis
VTPGLATAIRPGAPSSAADRGLRVGIIADFAEEHWISMETAAEVLLTRFGLDDLRDIDATRLRPAMHRRLTRIPCLAAFRRADTADRVINRYWDYPRWLRRHRDHFDLFHIVDHTYAHLVLELPVGRTVVTVHDVDAFLPLVDPERTVSTLPRRFAARTLEGLRQAARIICVSDATRAELAGYHLVPLHRSTVVHNGVDPDFSPASDPVADAAVARLIGPVQPTVVDLVHCGTTIPRKRIDLLLQVLAAVRQRDTRVRLLKVGGALTLEQRGLAGQLHVDDAIVQLPFLDRRQLASVYRRARAAIITSDREGFCLPLVEALACGTAVVGSDIPVLREIGAGACAYAAVDDVPRWADSVIETLGTAALDAHARQRRLTRAAAFSWDRHAAAVAQVYRPLRLGR